jgi:hypothetical protein
MRRAAEERRQMAQDIAPRIASNARMIESAQREPVNAGGAGDFTVAPHLST